jgi:ribosomal protein S18 acetylase RimI-like enzyme
VLSRKLCLNLFMNFEIQPAHELPLAEQATVFNRAFAGYLAGWHDLDGEGAVRLICAQGIDLCYSRFVRANGALVGFGFISRTGNVSRLAGMGVVPEARRSGAASFIVSHLLDEAKERSDEAMVLEVFEQNVPALALYRHHNFRDLMRLFGWRVHKFETHSTAAVEEISLLTASEMRSAVDFPDIPWQVSRHAVMKLADARAYKIDKACVVISNPKTPPIRIHALLGDSNASRNALATVLGKFPGSEFFAPAIFPERFGAQLFQPLGFAREPLNQILMRHDLRP